MEPNQPQPTETQDDLNDPVVLTRKVIQIEKDCETALQIIEEITKIVDKNMSELGVIKPLLKSRLKEISNEKK